MTTKPLASIGIDIGKEVFHVVGFGTDGKIAFRRKIKRLGLLEAFKLLPPSIVCVSAWGPDDDRRGVPSSQFDEINGLKGS